MKKIPVVEIFGPVVQGEGDMVGQQTYFLRLGGCDYRCSWCDTMYAVDPKQVKANSTMMTEEEIWQKLEDLSSLTHVRTLTISGGNPCMHNIGELIKMLGNKWYLALETQGTIWQEWVKDCDTVTISPKPPSSGMSTNFAKLEEFVSKIIIRGTGVIKIVAFDPDDYQYAKELFNHFHNKWGDHLKFYLQPGTEFEGLTTEQIRALLLDRTEVMTDAVVNDPQMSFVRVIPQLHTLIYGSRRGV